MDDYIIAYTTAMGLLYQKELGPDAQRSDWYRSRGFSTDTQVEANVAVFTALDVIHALSPSAQVRRVLIVGPGLDFAPRTGLRDLPPQSYQPYLVLDALLRRTMGDPSSISIHAVDIEPRVVHFVQEFPPYAVAGPSAREPES